MVESPAIQTVIFPVGGGKASGGDVESRPASGEPDEPPPPPPPGPAAAPSSPASGVPPPVPGGEPPVPGAPPDAEAPPLPRSALPPVAVTPPVAVAPPLPETPPVAAAPPDAPALDPPVPCAPPDALAVDPPVPVFWLVELAPQPATTIGATETANRMIRRGFDLMLMWRSPGSLEADLEGSRVNPVRQAPAPTSFTDAGRQRILAAVGDARIEPDESVATLPPDPDVGPSPVGVPASTANTPRDGCVGQDTSAPGVSARELVGCRYEILGLLGSGGMGTVYRARDRELDEVVALKMLRRELVEAPSMLERFRQEAKLARRVTHRNVARTFDIGEHATAAGTTEKFLTMEYVEGESLAALLGRTGAQPLRRALEILTEMCGGLVAAHAAGVVHRDLKPDNVLVGKDGRIVITDFGIARSALAGSSQTREGMVGTPAYMAPEQVEGTPDIDARADLYALGTIAYELLTGERAWPGNAVYAVAAARLTQPPAELMARRREERPPDASQVSQTLARIGDALNASGVATLVPVPAPAQRLRMPVGDKTVAVLSFRNGGPPEDDYLADGVTEDLVDTLSMTRGLRVRPRGTTSKLARDADPREAGQALGVQVVVDGSVRKVGEQIRLAARLISVADGFQLWAQRFNRPAADVLLMNDEVARAVALALTADLQAPAREAPKNAEAVDLYLRGLHELNRSWYGTAHKAVALFEQALVLSPDDPSILSTYARAAGRLTESDAHTRQQSRQAAERAIALAPRLGEPWVANARVQMSAGQPVAAARSLRNALERAPNHGLAHEIAGILLIEAGDHPQDAMARLELASRLDPSVTQAPWDRVRGHALLGQWTEVDAAFALQPVEPAAIFQRVLFGARFSLWRPDGRGDDIALPELQGFVLPMRIARLYRAVHATRSLTDEQRTFLLELPEKAALASRLRPLFHQIQAEALAFLGEHEGAMASLAGSVAAGLYDRAWMRRCPVIAPLRADARWPQLEAHVTERADEIRDTFFGKLP